MTTDDTLFLQDPVPDDDAGIDILPAEKKFPEITGILREGREVYSLGTTYLVGFIHGDLLARFGDGKFIHTSPIVKKHSLYETESGNFYLVEEQ